YYQPAGPLINVPPPHAHPQPSSLGKSAPLSEVSSSPTPPPSHQAHSQSSTADSLDSDVIITSATSAKESLPSQPPPPQPAYRYTQYPAPHPGYSYGYPPQYYPAPPPAPSYHHELCYPPSPYLHHKAYPPPTYRRHLAAPAGTQYYQANPPDLYHPPPSAPTQPSQQVVTATPAVSSAYQPSGPPPPLIESYPPPPPPTLVDPYPPPPHYYPGYGPAPPPSCYTHSPPTRTLPYINAAYQSCPCPIQSCPKNVHTGPLTGDSKRSAHISSIAKDSLPLPPVALALPLEPVSATGPPSPARGSAGMPPPPSPAGATYQPPPPAPKQEGTESTDCKPIEKRRKARIGKNMVRNNIAANFPGNTMLLMCHAPQNAMCVPNVKREIESPEEQKPCSDVIITTLKSKMDTKEVTTSLRTSSSTEIITDSSTIKVQKDATTTIACLKTEEQTAEQMGLLIKSKEVEVNEEKPPVLPDELLPCQKTVAENVKVKNMKRKLSITRDLEKIETDPSPPQKKQKIEKTKVNGSYKDLIKKHVPSIKINNGKRKLNVESDKPLLNRNSKMKLKKTLKRKLSPTKEETNHKKLKTSKPLAASNLHNSKQNLKNNKGKCFVDFELSENKEPLVKTTKKSQVNSKNSLNNNNNTTAKKLAPAILDSLFAKNNVDRTIESVINRYSDSLRTNKKTETNIKATDKCKLIKSESIINNKSTNSKMAQVKSKTAIVSKKIGASKRKTKSKGIEIPSTAVTRVPRKYMQVPRWSNGWTWKGEPFQAKVFLNSDESTVTRRCYPAMKHAEGDVIEPRDCVLLKAGPRRNDLPFVAKVAALWENPDDGEMMMSLLWYYRPEHTEQGRQPYDESDEVFASRHKDTNSVACIEDKCYVLTFNEYCRYRKTLRRLEEGMEATVSCIPNPEPYPRLYRQPPSTVQTPPELVFFCRRVYDFRQKRIVKNPS
ncbi:hypothetical protein ILUMI_02236, partial [Ignelater luminosus]